MNYETKRDVFNKLSAAYLEDEKRLDKLVNESDEHIPELDFMYFNKSYDAALPDDLPVIPKSISEYIKNLHKFHRDLVDVFGMVRDLGITRTEPTGVLVWVTHNIDTFARAWLLGVWEVKETGEILKLEAEK